MQQASAMLSRQLILALSKSISKDFLLGKDTKAAP
jgi:hypothetical protein